jgi:hypothetical protein
MQYTMIVKSPLNKGRCRQEEGIFFQALKIPRLLIRSHPLIEGGPTKICE